MRHFFLASSQNNKQNITLSCCRLVYLSIRKAVESIRSSKVHFFLIIRSSFLLFLRFVVDAAAATAAGFHFIIYIAHNIPLFFLADNAVDIDFLIHTNPSSFIHRSSLYYTRASIKSFKVKIVKPNKFFTLHFTLCLSIRLS